MNSMAYNITIYNIFMSQNELNWHILLQYVIFYLVINNWLLNGSSQRAKLAINFATQVGLST